MSTPVKILLLLLSWIVYTFVVFRSCQKDLCLSCGDSTEQLSTNNAIGEAPTRYPIDFKWSEANPNLNEGGSEAIKALASERKGTQILEIVGFYFEGEPKPAGFDNLGFARAAEIKKLVFEAGVPENMLQIRARALEEAEGVRENPFVGFEGRLLEPEQKEVETVEELNDRIIIRFPIGSDRMIYDKAVMDYLEKLALQVQKTGESVILTGHTDNTGTPEKNLELGKDRAAAIQKILIQKGVKAAQVTMDSKGQTQPVTANSTPEGRAENRRVEVRLIKK